MQFTNESYNSLLIKNYIVSYYIYLQNFSYPFSISN